MINQELAECLEQFGRALDKAADKERIRLRRLTQELAIALNRVLPYVATQATGCYGDRCGEPWCFSCQGADDAFSAAQQAQEAYRKALTILLRNQKHES